MFLPWLDSQQAQNDQAQVAFGSFTREIGKDSTLSWVATGPFTGCHAVTYRSGDDYTFCHLVTGAGTRPLNDQKTGIQAARSTSVEAASTQISVPANMGHAQGFAFWMRGADGKWRQRTLWIGAGPKPWKIVGREAAVTIDG